MSDLSPVLLSVSHRSQRYRSDCLAACAEMVLAHLEVPIAYPRLIKTLRIDINVGAPFSNILRLENRRLLVIVEHGTVEMLYRLLSAGWPVIVAVDTAQLPYWDESTYHAVVVVGMDEQMIYINDPAFATAPIQITHEEFALAWFEHDDLYALLVPN